MKRIKSITLVNTTYENIDLFKGIDTANIPWKDNDMTNAFQNCINLSYVSNLNNNVTNMIHTFNNCSNLTNVSSIPNNVIDMNYTFDNCQLLRDIPSIPNSVTSMHGTFKNCQSLRDVPSIPNSVTDLSFSFDNCQSLQNAPEFIENSNVVSLEGAFQHSGIVSAPNLVNCFKLTDMRETFFDCSDMLGIPMIPNTVTNLSHTFSFCNAFKGKADRTIIHEKNYYGYNCIEDEEVIASGSPGSGDNEELNDSETPVSDDNNGGEEITTQEPEISPLSLLGANEENNPILSFSLDNELNIGTILYFTDFYGYETDDYKIDYEYTEGYTKYYIVRNYGDDEYGIVEESKIDPETHEPLNNEDIIRYIIESNINYDFLLTSYEAITDDKAVIIPNSVVNMSGTFGHCVSLETLPNLNNATMVNSLDGCFSECYNLSGIPDLSPCSNVTNLERTFYNCSKIEDGMEKNFYGWKDINDEIYFATNDGIEINIGDDLYSVEKITIGENLYAYVYSYDEQVEVEVEGENEGETQTQIETITKNETYYLKNETAEIGDIIYANEYGELVEYDTVKAITMDEYEQPIIEFNTVEKSAARYDDYDIREHYEYNIDVDDIVKITDVSEEANRYTIKYFKRNDETEYENVIERFDEYDEENITVYGLIVLPEHTTDMYQTFSGCNIIKTPVIPNSVTNMARTFEYCSNLIKTSFIPNSVTNMYYTFAWCTNLTGDIYIESEEVINAYRCFHGTVEDKNVYIPFKQGANYTNTYNAFTNAGYSDDPENRVNGVVLIDINGPDALLADYEHDDTYIDENNYDATLYNYINTVNEDIITPRV